ncbi:hypothetical protein O7623_10440 [Solwaraspora sp. WMMD791]|uniref:hypothetical protein n=1 Tax=Solwaraspora sp. WMMD791 TaxID=3016086 RepID=UPI00249C1B2C|nr:hypothetical protein [Solwaraspora sp. WMMD791]WFE29570.1 hypothetical protein O7623_10440 [Solwaraspora sp. WMMD791]
MTSWSALTRYAMSRSALGGGLAAGLAVGTMVGVPPAAPPDTTPAAAPPRVVATQPDLGTVLLAAADLPAGYRPVAAADPASADDGRGTTPTADGDVGTGCRRLFERPWSSADDGDRPATDQLVARYQGPRGASLRQSLTLLDPAAAGAAAADWDSVARRCVSFAAHLDDGTPVTVRVHRRERVPVGTAWSLLVSVTDRTGVGNGPQTGYLALAHDGGLLATVRHLGPIGAVTPGDAAALLTRATAKVDPAAPLLRHTAG